MLRKISESCPQTSGQYGPKTEKAGHIHVLPNFCYSVSCCGQSGTVSSEVSITISSAGFKSSVKSCCRPTLVTSILFTHIPIHGNCLLNSSIKSYISAVASLSSDYVAGALTVRKTMPFEEPAQVVIRLSVIGSGVMLF